MNPTLFFLWCFPKGCLCLAAVMLPPFCSPPRGTLLQEQNWDTRWTPVASFPSPLRSSRCSQMWVQIEAYDLVFYCALFWWLSLSVSSRICRIPNHSTRNVPLLEMAASSRTANVERKLTQQILSLGIHHIILQWWICVGYTVVNLMSHGPHNTQWHLNNYCIAPQYVSPALKYEFELLYQWVCISSSAGATFHLLTRSTLLMLALKQIWWQ